jgi:hypothetical protein
MNSRPASCNSAVGDFSSTNQHGQTPAPSQRAKQSSGSVAAESMLIAAIHVTGIQAEHAPTLDERNDANARLLDLKHQLARDRAAEAAFLSGHYPDMGLDETALESRIDQQALLLHTAPTVVERKQAWAELSRLVALRSSDRVAQMERDRGLR